MGILGEQFEGRIVIGWSGHKSENTVKQYIRKLPTKKKQEIAKCLNDNMQPPEKQPKMDQRKFQFKANPPATVSKAPEVPTEQPQNVQNQENLPNIQYDLQALDDAPADDVLIKFLEQFDPVTENPPIASEQQPLAPTMNINNVQNVQNNESAQRVIPNMYFGGHSTVTINYNFGPNRP